MNLVLSLLLLGALNLISVSGMDASEKEKLIRVLRNVPQFGNFFQPQNNFYYPASNFRPNQPNNMPFAMPQPMQHFSPMMGPAPQPHFFQNMNQPLPMPFFQPPVAPQQQQQQRPFQSFQSQPVNKPAFKLEEDDNLFGECGILKPKIRNYVSGGKDTDHSLWPWFVQVVIAGNNRSDSETYCGGTLIHNEYVLTAAHCYDDLLIQNRGKNTIVLFKGIDLMPVYRPRQGKKPDNTIRVKAKNVYIHRSYIPAMSEYEARQKQTVPGPLSDIALIHLKFESAEVQASVMPVCLPKENYELRTNTRCKIMGHGFMSASDEDNFIMPSKLQMADVKISQNQDCRNTVESMSIKSKINADTICILGPIHPCVGDSGGPLICAGDASDKIYGESDSNGGDDDDDDDEAEAASKRWFLNGVTSFAVSTDEEDRCGQFKSAVFGKVSHYVEWIREIIRTNKMYNY